MRKHPPFLLYLPCNQTKDNETKDQETKDQIPVNVPFTGELRQ